MNHLQVLKFELKAAKAKLVSEQGIADAYRNTIRTGRGRMNHRSAEIVLAEYVQKFIPRTERLIEALEFAIPLVENRY